MFLFESEAILGRIHAHLAAWRSGRPSAQLLAEVQDEFCALKDSAAVAGFDDIAALSRNVETFLGGNRNVVDSDGVSLLNLLEEIYDGLKADLGFIPAVEREHVQSLNSMMASLLAGETDSAQSATEQPHPPDDHQPAVHAAPAEAAAGQASQPPDAPPQEFAREFYFGEPPQESPPDAQLSAIRDYLPRLQRFAESTAGRSGKSVELSLHGGDIEIDRRVMERMLPPFEQMLRNSIEHGIESAEQRSASGKEAAGRIRITAVQQGAELLLEYADDGGGLDRGKLLARAVEIGLVGSAADIGYESGGQESGEQYLLQIITQPACRAAGIVGETTGETTGETDDKTTGENKGETAQMQSDRGGGMNTVYHAVRKLGGLMALKSEVGKGICFQFRLPPTLAESRVLLVTLGRHRFALRAGAVERLMRVPREEVTARDGRKYARVGGRPIPVIDLAEQIGERGTRAQQPFASLVLIRLADRITAFEVDEFHHVIDVVNKRPGLQPTTLRAFAGVAVLADFSTLVILDPGAFIDRGTLQPDGLTRFPLSRSGAADLHRAAQPPSKKNMRKKTMRAVVLETKLGPLLIPIGMVAAIVGTLRAQPCAHRHEWIGGEFHWRGFTIPLVDSEIALGAEREETRRHHYAIILWPMKDCKPDEFFALGGLAPPRVIEIDSAACALQPDAAGQVDNLPARVRLGERIGFIPDLKNLAHEISHDR